MGGVVDRKRSLREECEVRSLRDIELGHMVDGLDQRDRAFRDLAEGPDDLGVTRMADVDGTAPTL